MQMLVLMLTLIVLIIKALWGIVGYSSSGVYLIAFVIVAIVIKVICIFLAWIVSVRSE
jgi:hypothetical protein